MKVSLVNGTISFSLIVIDNEKLLQTETMLDGLSPNEEFFGFLPSGVVVKEFDLIQETTEKEIEI